jgi:endothelin-converting enzyme
VRHALTYNSSQPDLGLPTKEYYEEKDTMKLYQDVIEKLLTTIYEAEDEEEDENQSTISRIFKKPVFRVLEETTWPPWPWPPWGGDDEPKTPVERATGHAKKVVEFERTLAKATLDLDILYGDPYATYNPVSVRNLSQTIPQVHFETYFTAFAPRNYPQKIIVTSYDYAKKLGKILDDTPEQIIEAYLVTRAALELSPHLGLETDAWKAQRTLFEALQGIKKGAIGDRGEYCVEKVEEAMGFAAGRYFANETFGGDSRQKGEKVIFDIIKAFEHSLEDIEWMDKESAEAAKRKVTLLPRNRGVFVLVLTLWHVRRTISESRLGTR